MNLLEPEGHHRLPRCRPYSSLSGIITADALVIEGRVRYEFSFDAFTKRPLTPDDSDLALASFEIQSLREKPGGFEASFL
jgi:hypothetical protein